jgi:predicted TPR repeat methyltransferase
LEPDNSIAKHLLDSLLGNDSEKASPAYVEELFDQYASRFETHLAESLQYKTPAALHSMIKKNLSEDFRFSNILDLGCGTGLCGSLFRSHCEKLYGVDISTKMIQQAHGKKIYDELKAQEIIEYLAQTEVKFGLFMAADVFVYLGNLEPVFQAVSAVAESGARFIFSTETSDKGFSLKASGRFGHSNDYVEKIADKFNWNLEDVKSDTLRVENAQNVSGNLFFFKLKN